MQITQVSYADAAYIDFLHEFDNNLKKCGDGTAGIFVNFNSDSVASLHNKLFAQFCCCNCYINYSWRIDE